MSEVKHFDIDGVIIDIPVGTTVNNGTLTIQKNGTNVATFSANQSSNVTANITVPTKTSELTNDSGYTTNTGTVTQVKVGSTAYNPSSGVVSLPAYPTVNNGTLTIQKNGSNVATFTANQSGNATANITVPTKVSELTNDSGFITDAGVTGVKGNSETNYRTGNVNITKSNIGLGNVPNVTTNNQTPTFTQASSRANIASGETLATIFGKIMKWFADLKTVAFSGSYSDLSDKPTIPTVNNGTLTIQKNGTNVATFTANQSGNATANITVPTVNNGTLTIQKNGTNVATFTANQSGNATANIGVPTLTTLGTASIASNAAWVSTGITIPTYYGLVYLQFAPTAGVAGYSCVVSSDLLRAATETLPYVLYRGSYNILFKCVNNVLYYYNGSGGTANLSVQIIRFL